jgi:hypothetical protein
MRTKPEATRPALLNRGDGGAAARKKDPYTIMANDPSTHPVMAVLDTAIHAFLF